MPIRHETSDLFRDQLSAGAVPDAVQTKGVRRAAVGTVTNLADDETGSTFRLCSIPSHAILHPDTVIDVQAWGFAQVVIGSAAIPDQLVDQTRATENLVTPFAWGDANHGKRLWELLGMATDPGTLIDIYAHAEANATGAGTMPFAFEWIDNQ
ncbi:MAG: hypothetical protein AAF899_09680 [Pseudomonadota bacterium]